MSKTQAVPSTLHAEVDDLRLELQTLRQERDSLAREHGQMRELIEGALFPIIVVDHSSGQVRFMNSFACAYFEIELDQAVGRMAVDFWQVPARRLEYLSLLEQHGMVEGYQANLVTDNGTPKYALLSSRRIKYQGKDSVYTVFSDLTPRIKAERALKESEQRFLEMYRMMKMLCDTVPDLLWVKDREDRYLFGNKALREKLLMCRQEETLIGQTDMYFADRERQDGHTHSFGEICINSDQVVKDSGKPGRFLEDGLVRGEYLALDVYKSPLFNDQNELIGTVGAGRVVTRDLETQKALEASEARFRMLAENVRDVLWVTDQNFVPNYITPSIEELSGYPPAEFLSLPIEMHITPRFRRKFYALRRKIAFAAKEGREIQPRFLEFQCHTKNGKPIWVEIITAPIYDNQGELQGFTGVMRDSTKRVVAQQELIDARQQALTASQTKSEFLANMSHEIRTPMNGVLGLLQLLKESNLSPQQEKYVDTALNSGTSLLNLLCDILDFSKIEAGKIELTVGPVCLAPLLQSVVESFESLVDKSQVNLSWQVEETVPPWVVLDGSRLRQILFNLVSNGVKFTSKGKVALSLSATPQPEGRVTLFFRVKDTGVGISQEVAPRLFEPFVQEDGSFRRRHGGTGLGLSIVKKLVELMGGRVQLASSLKNRGTTASFNITVPVLAAEDTPAVSQPITLLPQMRKIRILVVEDEGINAMVISAMLEKMGHQVTMANNGRQALERLQEATYDCILMDIQMPELDGLETTRIIRKKSRKCRKRMPIIALTAHAMKGDRERFLAAGMDDYLCKPVNMESLMVMLSQLA